MKYINAFTLFTPKDKNFIPSLGLMITDCKKYVEVTEEDKNSIPLLDLMVRQDFVKQKFANITTCLIQDPTFQELQSLKKFLPNWQIVGLRFSENIPQEFRNYKLPKEREVLSSSYPSSIRDRLVKTVTDRIVLNIKMLLNKLKPLGIKEVVIQPSLDRVLLVDCRAALITYKGRIHLYKPILAFSSEYANTIRKLIVGECKEKYISIGGKMRLYLYY